MVAYELTLVLKPDLSEEDIEKITASLGGEITGTQQWGKRMLAYPIEKYKEGTYIHMNISFDAQKIKDVQQSLNIHDDVLRYLLIRE